MDVQEAAAGKDALEFILEQLVHTGAAGDDDGTNIQIIKGIGDAVEEDAVLHGQAPPLGLVAAGALGVATAEVTGGQHRLHTLLVEERQGRQADIREEALGAAAGEVENGLHLLRAALGVAQDGHLGGILQAQDLAEGFFRHLDPDRSAQ